MVAENQVKVLSCCPVLFPTMCTEDNNVPRKLKFKITAKGIRDASEDKLPQGPMKVVVKKGDRSTAGGKKCPINLPEKQNLPANYCKRKPDASLDVQKGKRLKMGQGLKHSCHSILKELMNHPGGWIFNEPVDPVKLQIPDYFSIITQPMDLGTVKHKLEGYIYFSGEEFASDVRLTFSNAMLYNPPENKVHHLAKVLDGNFSRRWKLMEAKLKNLNKNVEQASFVDGEDESGLDIRKKVEKNRQGKAKPTSLEKAPLRIKLGTSRPMSIEEKQNFRMELMELLDRKLMGNLQTLFQKLGLAALNEERLDSFISSTGDETLWKLRRDIKDFLDAEVGKVRPAIFANNGPPPLKKPAHKESLNEGAYEAIGNRFGSVEANCSSCVSFTCHCQRKNGSQVSTSEISSERSAEHDHCGDCKVDSEGKHPVASRTSSFGVDSDGPGVVLNEENSPHLSTPAAAATSFEGWNSFNTQMSPKKALRAAMLKSRFADTIFKATHQKILDNSDPLRMQQERARLEKEQMEERARIKAEIQAAKAASQSVQSASQMALDDMRMRREQERAAARRAIEMMEKTVEIYENVDLSKEVEKLFCGYPSYSHNGGACGGRPLERLGLYIKDDFLEEDEDVVLYEEEGEIL